MIRTALAALLLLPGACQAGEDPSYRPPCPGEVVILPSSEAPVDCDVRPPQLLAYWADDPGPIQEAECADVGGILLHTRHGRELCFDIDY